LLQLKPYHSLSLSRSVSPPHTAQGERKILLLFIPLPSNNIDKMRLMQSSIHVKHTPSRITLAKVFLLLLDFFPRQFSICSITSRYDYYYFNFPFLFIVDIQNNILVLVLVYKMLSVKNTFILEIYTYYFIYYTWYTRHKTNLNCFPCKLYNSFESLDITICLMIYLYFYNTFILYYRLLIIV